jgi:hypothetical protein
VDIRFPDGKLAFRYDTERGIVQIAQRGTLHFFDLAELTKQADNLPIAQKTETC